VFATRGWMRFALLLNLFGTVLLFLSFQATSSNFRLITTSQGDSALCVDQRALIISYAVRGMSIGTMDCPDWQNARPAAVVNVERPSFVTLGFICTTLGFLLQFLSIPTAKTIHDIRKELKELQRAEQLLRKLNPDTGLPHSKNSR
jgi:hypothetical protein